MAWSRWTSLGHPPSGPFKDEPAVSSWGPGRLDVFVRGADDQLWHRFFDNGMWSDWEAPNPGTLALASAPAAASWAPGRIDVFALGQGDQRLWHTFYDPTVGGNVNGWQQFWEGLGGLALTSKPSVASVGPNQLDVFARGPNDNLYHRSYVNGMWLAWENLGGVLSTYPAAFVRRRGRLGVVAKFPGGKYKTMDIYAVWVKPTLAERWIRLGNSFELDYAATGLVTDLTLLESFFDVIFGRAWNFDTGQTGQGSTPSTPANGRPASAPAAISWGGTRLDIFIRGTDGNLWHIFDPAAVVV